MNTALAKTTLATFSFFALGVATQAGSESPEFRTGSKEVTPRSYPFEKGAQEFQALGGAFFSFSPNSSDRTTFNYAIASLRWGWMLSTPHGDGFFRGNYEFLLEAFGGGVWDGPGSFLAGGTLLIRYNFVQPEARLVPYFQLGAGGLYSDAYEDESQRAIGSAFEFNLQGSVGLRWFCTDRCAFTVEGGYRHISNANTADRNVGVNSLGAHVGVSLFF